MQPRLAHLIHFRHFAAAASSLMSDDSKNRVMVPLTNTDISTASQYYLPTSHSPCHCRNGKHQRQNVALFHSFYNGSQIQMSRNALLRWLQPKLAAPFVKQLQSIRMSITTAHLPSRRMWRLATIAGGQTLPRGRNSSERSLSGHASLEANDSVSCPPHPRSRC
jgi:hypothetical protein